MFMTLSWIGFNIQSFLVYQIILLQYSLCIYIIYFHLNWRATITLVGS